LGTPSAHTVIRPVMGMKVSCQRVCWRVSVNYRCQLCARIYTYVVRRHSVVGLAIAQQHAEAFRSVIGLTSACGLLVGQEPEHVVGKQDFRAVKVTDNVWHWRERKCVSDLDDFSRRISHRRSGQSEGTVAHDCGLQTIMGVEGSLNVQMSMLGADATCMCTLQYKSAQCWTDHVDLHRSLLC
jgi:hypothetical protein